MTDRIRTRAAGILLALPVLAGLAPHAAGAQQPEKGWKDVAELTLVLTAGNATSSTFGFKNTTDHWWGNSSLQLAAGGVRARAGTVTRTASGTPDDYTVTKSTDTRTTAESYFLKARLDRKVSGTMFLFAGGGWDRNTFAGVDNRYSFVAGSGRTWFDAETRRFKTDLGLTYTLQDDVVENPDVADSFAGLRGTVDYFRKLTANTDYASVLVADESLNETDDLRLNWTNSLTVAMSGRLALKTSYQILFDNQPALVGVPLGTGSVFVSLEKVDSVFSVAIVANF
jgi:putative salt-induced outer membrane protein YdiY